MQQAQRMIHQPGEQAFDEKAAPEQETHQVSDGAVLAKRTQRTEIPVPERQQRLSAQAPLDLTDHVRSLLMRGLRARRNGGGLTLLRAGRAVADRENIGVARGL